MYEYCPVCGCRNIRKIAQNSDYATFQCEDCERIFDIDNCYLDYEYNEWGYKDVDEEDY